MSQDATYTIKVGRTCQNCGNLGCSFMQVSLFKNQVDIVSCTDWVPRGCLGTNEWEIEL